MNIPVYKYMKLEYVISMIKSKALSISKLSSWEDPYESFFYKSDFLLSGDKTIQGPNIEQIFGQSWTMQEESDAMWRIYSDKDNKDSVRIRTTADKLFKATYVNNYCMASTYIGRVKYVSGAEISRWLNSISPITDIHDFQYLGIQSFFLLSGILSPMNKKFG